MAKLIPTSQVTHTSEANTQAFASYTNLNPTRNFGGTGNVTPHSTSNAKSFATKAIFSPNSQSGLGESAAAIFKQRKSTIQ